MIGRDPDSVRAADVAFVRQDRIHLTPKRGYFPGAPDLAVEVLSPDDTPTKTGMKVEAWLEAGTGQVWIVDPDRRTLVVHEGGRPSSTLHEGDQLVSEALLPGFCLTVAEIFR